MSTLIFDLDGTLIDSSKIVIPAYIKALRHFPHITIPPLQEMLATFGLPDNEIWERLMPNCTAKTKEEAFLLTSSYVNEEIMEQDIVMEGARDVLFKLRNRGHRLTVASNCGLLYLHSVLDGQGLRQYFENPLCLESVSGYRKEHILAHHLRTFEKRDCYMIGDRDTDVQAAAVHGIPTIGCNFGFGNIDELKNAERVIVNLQELLDIF